MEFKFGWFSTGRDQAAIDLFQVIYDGIRKRDILAEISFVFTNRQKKEALITDEFLKIIECYDLPLLSLSSQRFLPNLRKENLEEWRTLYHREVEKLIQPYKPNLIVLAGYMLIVSPELCQKYNMINLHPALPGGPRGTWQEVIWQLIEARAIETGAMMHLVTPELDGGPPITYYSFSLRGLSFEPLWNDLEKKLKEKSLNQIIEEEGESNLLFNKIRKEGVKRELPLIYFTLKEMAQGKIEIRDGKVFEGGKEVKGGYCLNEQISQYLKGEEKNEAVKY